jgi:hypothetical protein
MWAGGCVNWTDTVKILAMRADRYLMDKLPKVTAADLKAAATRLAGTVVAFIEDNTVGAAVYKPRAEMWASIDGDEIGSDDGTVIDLLDGVPARDLIDAHGTPGRAAAAINRKLRAEWTA